MPFIVVTAAEPADPPAALTAVGSAVAAALGLAGPDVVTMLCPVSLALCDGVPVSPWPVVVLHGRNRPPAAMAAARDAAREAVAAGWGCPPEEVWAGWHPDGPQT